MKKPTNNNIRPFMKQPGLPTAPAHLQKSTREWFTQIVQQFVLDDHHVKLLIGCCEALDRASEARRAIDKHGAYIKNRFGEIRKHPGIGVERDAMVTFARLLRELGLDIADDAPRPNAIRGGRHA